MEQFLHINFSSLIGNKTTIFWTKYYFLQVTISKTLYRCNKTTIFAQRNYFVVEYNSSKYIILFLKLPLSSYQSTILGGENCCWIIYRWKSTFWVIEEPFSFCVFIFLIKPFVKKSLGACVTGFHFATSFWFTTWRGSRYGCMGMCHVGSEENNLSESFAPD